MQTVLELLVGTFIGSQLTKDRLARYHHTTQRSDKSQEMDEDLEARNQTRNLSEWLANPESTDYVGVDDPHISGDIYEPWGEFE